MGVIPILEVVAFSDCDPAHPASNLLKPTGGRWATARGAHLDRVEAELRIPPSRVEAVDLGNFWSASVRIEVGRTGEPTSARRPLLDTKVLMSRGDSRTGENAEAMKFYSKGDFNPDACNEWWDRVRVVCAQPFRRDGFGLSVLVLKGQTREEKPAQSSPRHKEVMTPHGVEVLIERASRQVPSEQERMKRLGAGAGPTRESQSFRNHLFRKRAHQLFASKDPERKMTPLELQKVWYSAHPDRLAEADKERLSAAIQFHVQRAEVPEVRKRKVPDAVLALRGEEEVENCRSSAGSRNKRSVIDVGVGAEAGDERKRAKPSSTSTSDLEGRGAESRSVRFSVGKSLPLRGGRTLSAKSGKEVRFYREGRACYVLYEGTLYDLDLGASQEEKVFGRCRPGPSSSPVQCPLCQGGFPAEAIVKHYDACAAGGGGGKSEGPGRQECPVCGESMIPEELAEHAPACADRAYGNG